MPPDNIRLTIVATATLACATDPGSDRSRTATELPRIQVEAPPDHAHAPHQESPVPVAAPSKAEHDWATAEDSTHDRSATKCGKCPAAPSRLPPCDPTLQATPIQEVFSNIAGFLHTRLSLVGILTSVHPHLLLACSRGQCCPNRPRGRMLVSSVLEPDGYKPAFQLGAPGRRLPFECTLMCCGFEQGFRIVVQGRLECEPDSDDWCYLDSPRMCRLAATPTPEPDAPEGEPAP